MPRSDTSSTQEYFLPGYELSRHIVLRQIQYFLGPSASVRPYSNHGREGYLIRGPSLTKEQIGDLKRQSREYERQQSLRTSKSGSSDPSDPDINEPIVLNHGRRSPTYSSYRPYR